MTNDTLNEIGFWAFTIAFAPSQPVVEAVERQLLKWWKRGIEDCDQAHRHTPLHLSKEYNPQAKTVAVYELESAAPVTLIESNLNDGYLSLSHVLARELTTTTFAVVRSKLADHSEYPIEEFGLINESQGGYIRHIWAALDTGGWKFANTGELLRFEEPDHYKKRSIRDRFTRIHIVDFLQELGVDLRSVTEPDRYARVKCFTEAQQRP